MNIVTNIQTKPIRNKHTGQILNDLEFARVSLDAIEKFEEKYKKPSPVSGDFKQFLKDLVTECSTPEDVVTFKKLHIRRTVPIEQVVKNTELANQKAR